MIYLPTKIFPFFPMYSQLLILSRFIIPSKLYILPFIRATLALLNSLQVTNTCFVSFFTNDGYKIAIGVSFNILFNILSSFISIYTGFNISCRSNFCCPLTITVSNGSFIWFFLFFFANFSKRKTEFLGLLFLEGFCGYFIA